jgi:hypothetical protein
MLALFVPKPITPFWRLRCPSKYVATTLRCCKFPSFREIPFSMSVDVTWTCIRVASHSGIRGEKNTQVSSKIVIGNTFGAPPEPLLSPPSSAERM